MTLLEKEKITGTEFESLTKDGKLPTAVEPRTEESDTAQEPKTSGEAETEIPAKETEEQNDETAPQSGETDETTE